MSQVLRGFSVVFLSGILLTGCGYSTRSVMTNGFKTIYVAPFKNQIVYGSENEKNIYLPLMEIKVSKAIIDRYLFDGNLKIATENAADAILTGELIDYKRESLRYDDNNDVLEYRIRVSVSMRLRDVANDKISWEENRFSGEATYFVSGALAISEDTAVDNAVKDLARRVVERTIENW